MAEVTRVIAKGYFNTGDVPTETQFANLIDSIPFFADYGFTALPGSSWDGSNKVITLEFNYSLTFVPVHKTGILIVYQDATGGRTLEIEGESIPVNSTAGSLSVVQYFYNDYSAEYIFEVSTSAFTLASGAPPPGDVTPPTLSSATVENATPSRIDLNYNETLDSASIPANGDFTPSGGKTVTGVAIIGGSVQVTVNTPYANGNVITVSYTPGTNKIQDVAGNDAASLSSQAVTNNIAGGGSYDADALAYFTAEEAASGGTLSTGAKTAVNNLVLALKAGGNCWAQIKAFYPFLGSGLRNLKTPGNTDADFRLVQGTGTAVTFADAVGATFNGANYLRTKIFPNTHLATNSMTLGCGLKDYSGAAAMGTKDNTSSGICYMFADSGGNAIFNLGTSDLSMGANSNPMRLLSSVRDAGGGNWSKRAMKNGSVVHTSGPGAASLTGGDYEIILGGLNNDNSPGAYITGKEPYAVVGLGFDDTEQNEFDAAVAAFITAMGR